MRSVIRGGVMGPALVALAFATAGCSDERQSGSLVANRESRVLLDATKSPAVPGEKQGAADNAQAPGDDVKAATAGRKIIYNARVELVTEDLTALETKLGRLVQSHKGYVADTQIEGSAGSRRDGTWKIRIPVEAYDAFVKGIVALGELVSIKADSQDVSEEFYDLDARQTTKKVEESRLLKHLTDSTGKLDEILAVERELSRVRGEIERIQGRIRVIENLSSLTTVTLTAREIKGYAPPQAPTFLTRVERTFSASVDALRQFGEAAVLFMVGLTPWLPMVGLVVLMTWMVRRRARRGA